MTDLPPMTRRWRGATDHRDAQAARSERTHAWLDYCRAQLDYIAGKITELPDPPVVPTGLTDVTTGEIHPFAQRALPNGDTDEPF